MLYHEGLLLLEKKHFEAAQETLGRLSKESVNSKDLVIALGLSILHIRPVASTEGREHLAARKKFGEACVSTIGWQPTSQRRKTFNMLMAVSDRKQSG